jgi:hypothetical protein
MTRLNPDKFTTVMAELGITDLTTLSVLTLDRYLEAFREGNTTAASLMAAMLRPKFPRKMTLYAHFDQDQLVETGEQIGLSQDALREFTTCDPLPLDVEVQQDGTIIILGF